MSPTSSTPEPMVSADRLELTVRRSELTAIGLPALGRVRAMRGDERAEFILIATRRPFGWTLAVRGELPTWDGTLALDERVVHHEVVSREGAVALVEQRGIPVGHPCESNATYRWLVEQNFDPWPTWAMSRHTSLATHRARRALDHFRLRSLDAADARAHRLDAPQICMDAVPAALWDALLQAIEADTSGRVAQLAATRPGTIIALGVVLGDAPAGWVADGRLAAPLQLVAAGRRERDVLAAGIESGAGLTATDARVSRLRTFVAAAAWGIGRSAGGAWPYLGSSLDVPANLSWICRPQFGIARWARAQCWASARALPEPACRYVARYGGALASALEFPDSYLRLSRAFEAELRAESATLLRGRVAPDVLVRRAAAAPFPIWPEISDTAEACGIAVRRVASGLELVKLGRRLRNCLTNPYRIVSHDRHQYFVCESPDGAAIAQLMRLEDGTVSICDVLGPQNEVLGLATLQRVLVALRCAVPTLREEDLANSDLLLRPEEREGDGDRRFG